MASPRGKGFAHGVRLATLALWVGAWSMLVAQSCPSPNVTYIYDENGRLAAVVDTVATNNAAIYNYDAAGNITSITQQSASTVWVISFAPTCGPAGATTLTVYGTGFDTTASNNRVQFANSVTATATSATATQLTVSVPSTAGSGQIQVIAPGGTSPLSARAFTAGCGAPTITAFTACPGGQACATPHIGTPGMALTITGTNFDPLVLLNNRVGLNIDVAQVASASATTIATSVPPLATSGHVSVVTPFGRASTPDYFFVPPWQTQPTFVVSSVGPTDQITPTPQAGTTKTEDIPANKIALMVFDGIGGQRVSFEWTTTIPCCLNTLAVYNPDASTLAFTDELNATRFFDARTLPADGTYTILVYPQTPPYSGGITLTAYAVSDVNTTIQLGQSVPVTIDTPGQNARLKFSGTAGQLVKVQWSGGNFACCFNGLTILDRDGTTPLTPTANVDGPNSSGFTGTATLPAQGDYTILLDPSGDHTSSVTLSLQSG